MNKATTTCRWYDYVCEISTKNLLETIKIIREFGGKINSYMSKLLFYVSETVQNKELYSTTCKSMEIKYVGKI